jgi:hypothetical protein
VGTNRERLIAYLGPSLRRDQACCESHASAPRQPSPAVIVRHQAVCRASRCAVYETAEIEAWSENEIPERAICQANLQLRDISNRKRGPGTA